MKHEKKQPSLFIEDLPNCVKFTQFVKIFVKCLHGGEMLKAKQIDSI